MSAPNSIARPCLRIAGAGFSGLTAAYFLQKKLGPTVTIEIYDKAQRVGGLIQSEMTSFGLVEKAANAFLASTKLFDMAQDIGCPLIPARKLSRKRYIFRGGALRRWPLSLGETLKTLWTFVWAPSRAPRSRETIYDWGLRVLGPAATNFLLAPALQGIYAGDPKKLSATLILSRFFKAKKSPEVSPPYRGSVAPEKGMGSFLTALHRHLEAQGVRFYLGTPLPLEEASEATVLAVPPPAVEPLVSTLLWGAPSLRALVPAEQRALREFSKTEMVGITSLTIFYAEKSDHAKGFGVLFPRSEGQKVLGILFNKDIFPDRCPEAYYSETWIYHHQPDLSADEWMKIVDREREEIFKSQGRRMSFSIQHWPQAFPHYTVNLESALQDLPRADWARHGLYLCGNAYASLSLSQIVERNFELAQSFQWPSERVKNTNV